MKGCKRKIYFMFKWHIHLVLKMKKSTAHTSMPVLFYVVLVHRKYADAFAFRQVSNGKAFV